MKSVVGEVFYAATGTSIFEAGSRVEAARPAPSNGTSLSLLPPSFQYSHSSNRCCSPQLLRRNEQPLSFESHPRLQGSRLWNENSECSSCTRQLARRMMGRRSFDISSVASFGNLLGLSKQELL